MEARLDPIFQAAVDSKQVAGVSAVVLDGNGKALFSKGYGHVTAGDSSSAEVDPTTPGCLWSCTKLITSIAALQLIEQGKLSLDDPVEKFVPEIKSIKLLQGFNDDDSPNLRDATKSITVLHLITHTSGMSYDFFNPAETMRFRVYHKLPLVPYMESPKNAYYNVLLFEPGTRYEYGVNTDWLGFVVEKVSGMTLDDYIQANITGPLELKDIGAQYPGDRARPYMTVHVKTEDGVLTPTPMRNSPTAEVPHAGGGYLYGSSSDYAQILLALVNGGTHPNGAQILKPDTVKNYLFTDMLPRVGCSNKGVGSVPTGSLPNCSCEGEMLPGVRKGWSCGLLINHDDTPNGRPAGSGAWAGLGNCYYWADPQNKLVGFLMSETLPWFDRDILHLFDAMERAAYGKPAAKEVGEPGSNFNNGVNKNPAQPPAA